MWLARDKEVFLGSKKTLLGQKILVSKAYWNLDNARLEIHSRFIFVVALPRLWCWFKIMYLYETKNLPQ